jgi:Uma2 family endonuclease
MQTIEAVQSALQQLPARDLDKVAAWLEAFLGRHVGGYKVGEPPPPAYALAEPDFVTLEEFLESGVAGLERCEYINGVIRPIVGPSVAHARVTQHLGVALGAHLRGGPCEVFFAGLQFNLQIERNEIVYLPDIMVVCEKTGWGKNWIHNPNLVVEVHSPSTQSIDRREKLASYRQVESVEEYVMVAQDACEVTIIRRADEWKPKVIRGPGAVADFTSVGLSVPLAEIYDGVL